MGERLLAELDILRAWLGSVRRPEVNRVMAYTTFLQARELVGGPIWDLLHYQPREYKSIAIMLKLAMDSLSFFPGDPREPTDEQLQLFMDIADILKRDQVTLMDVRDVDERLRAVGLDTSLELDLSDMEVWKVDEGDMGEGD